MKSNNSSIYSFASSVSRAAAIMALAATPGAYAVSATWNGTTDATWATAGNWSASPVPGTATGEIATFANAGGADDVINLGGGVSIRTLAFDNAAAAAYTIGTGAAGSQNLTLEGTGAITMSATVAANQLVNANVNLGTAAGAEAFTITNSKAAASNSLTIAGGISTTQTGAKSLTVNGTGVINISGAIANGSGTIALAKAGANVLTLSGANSYSGGTTITGILNASNNTALGSGNVTVNGGVAGNQLQLGSGVTMANSLTLAGGGATAQGALWVPAGSATYDGTIAITGAVTAGAFFATGGGTLTLNNNITSTGPAVTVRTGYVKVTGAQSYTSGTTLANGGAAIQFVRTTSMPATGAVTMTTGTTLSANVGGAGQFTLGAGTNTAGTIGGLIAGVGGQGAAVVLPAGSQIGIDTTDAAGTQTWSAPFTTTNNVGLVKLGTGTLELTSGGTYTGGGAQGFPLIARQGTLLLSGGTHTANGEVVVGGTFGTAPGAPGYDATLQVDAGSLTTTGYLSLGRGNGTGAVSSNLTVNNAATVTAANFSAGFNVAAANLPKGAVTLNNTSALTVSGIYRLGESTGSNMTMTLNNSAQLIASAGVGAKRIGDAGTGVLTLNDSSSAAFGTGPTAGTALGVQIGAVGGNGTVNINGAATATFSGPTLSLYVGYRTGTGVVNMTGGTLTTTGEVRVGGSDVNGADNGSGTFNLSGGAANLGGGLTLGRGNNAAALLTGTANVSGGTLTPQTDIILGFAGAAGTLGKMVISGTGVVNVGPTAARTFVMSTFDTAKSQLDITGGSLNLGNNSSIKFFTGNVGTSGTAVVNQTGGAVTFYSDAGTTVGGTGVLDLAVFGSATSASTYNLDGGILTVPSVVSSNTAGTRLFNFNGGTLKAAVDGTLLNLTTTSATVRANVRDLGATIDTNGRNVTIPQALEASTVLGDVGNGGLTKKGAGTLKLSSFSNTYTGTTNVDAGTLDLDGVVNSNVVVKSGAVLTGVGTTNGTLTMQGGSTLTASTTAPLLTNGVVFSGPTNLVFTGTPSNGVPYPLFSYGSGSVTGLSNLSSSGFRTNISADIANQRIMGTVTTANLTWNTSSGTWAVNTGGWTGGATSYFNGDTVTFNERPAASTVTLNGVLLPASVVVNNTSNPYVFTGTGSIGGEAILTKSGAGALTLATANSYTGGTILGGGTLNLDNASALGTGLLTINGGTLDNTSGDAIVMTGNFPQLWNADINFTGTHSLDMGTGGVAIVGTVETDRAVTIAANTLGVGEITSTALGLIKQGPGTLTVNTLGIQANGSVIAGTLNVAAGALQINRTGGTDPTSGDFTAAGIDGTGTISNGAAVERWLIINTAGNNTFNGTLTNGGTGGLGFDKQGTGSVTLSGTLSYTGTTTVDAGTLSIPVANTGTGTGASVNAGTLVLGNPAALGTPANPAAPNTIRLAGNAVSTLDLAHDGGGPTYGFVFGTTTNATILVNRATAGAGLNHTLMTVGAAGVGAGTLTVSSGANVTSGTSRLTFTQFGLGADTVQTTVLNPTTASVIVGAVSKVVNATAQTLELGGTSVDNQITGLIANGTATVSVGKSNSSTWTISGANNTYTGGTRIGAANGAGVLRATASGALGTGTISFDGSGGAAPGGPTSRLELSNGITLANAITLNQRNNASAAILNVSGNNTLSGAIDLNIGGNRANIQSDADLLTLSGPILTTTANTRNLYLGGAGNGLASNAISNGTGTLNLTKEGTGTWTLTGTNIYTGTTTVTDGTLSIAQATLSNTAAVTVGTTAVLNLTHGATDTVDRFFIGGAEQASGTWGSLTSSATNKTARITGSGILFATNGVAVSGFGSWGTALGLTAGVNDGVAQSPDNDGFENGTEYILGGHPLNGSNNPKIYSLIADSDDAGSEKELIMTIAVPQGTPAFPAGSPTSTVTFEGFGITVRGSTDLATYPVTVNPVAAVIPAGATNPLVQGGITYEYRSFSLGGSNGTTGKGFLQVIVTNPAP
ncbi:autotransporter-associated beta strand repeat-containing protein [Luteolibacter arcticus]|uniref:Autotransporter-associated beta strand repeat-containing protein n=1 Tax=Luteolibacter arcticus TaxID=1581411 RepID=A0ABT3GPW4_9BACT|nr:autotransporter-associated beta strand repeat-containing protein [Luteolibacter arcticus]MCW1925564.1 autotransporter-associated beta strand repeat-containing protein [Luteolibacter arcticus]